MPKNPWRKRPPSSGFSLIELLIVVAIILIIAAIAVPNFLRARMAANESSAVTNLRTINSASVAYASTYGNSFPRDLAQLDGAGGAADCNAGQLIDLVLANATTAANPRSGYFFTYPNGGGVTATVIGSPPLGCTAGVLNYGVEANPAVTGTSGQRCFFTDQSSVIRFDPGGSGSCVDGAVNPPL